MTPTSDPETYDENSIFNRLLSGQPTTRKPSPSARLAAIFAEAPAAAEVIDVADFLPRY